MKVLTDRVKARRMNHDYYFEHLKGSWMGNSMMGFPLKTSSYGIYFLREPVGYFSNRWLTTILVNPEETGGISRDDIRTELQRQNIESRPLWKPMHQQPLYLNYPYYGRGVSDRLFKYGLCLPSGSNMTNADRLRVVNTINSMLKPVSVKVK